MARFVGLLCAAALACAAAGAVGTATCADEEDAAAGNNQVTLLQMGRNFSANSTEVELNSSDLTRQPLAGLDSQNATATEADRQPLAGPDGQNATAPEAGRPNILTQMYKRNGGATWTSAWTNGRGAQSLSELGAVENKRDDDWDWSPQVLTAVNIAVVLVIVGIAVGAAIAFIASRETPNAPNHRQERMTESLFVEQAFARQERRQDEVPGFTERRGGNDPCC